LQPIVPAEVEAGLQALAGRPVYLHLETTAGAYTENAVGVFIRNARVRYGRAAVRGEGPFRAGLQLEDGWLYAEGLTEWEVDGQGRLLLAGRDQEDRLAVALELSPAPFPL
jgi:hypothetical protein